MLLFLQVSGFEAFALLFTF